VSLSTWRPSRPSAAYLRTQGATVEQTSLSVDVEQVVQHPISRHKQHQPNRDLPGFPAWCLGFLESWRERLLVRPRDIDGKGLISTKPALLPVAWVGVVPAQVTVVAAARYLLLLGQTRRGRSTAASVAVGAALVGSVPSEPAVAALPSRTRGRCSLWVNGARYHATSTCARTRPGRMWVFMCATCVPHVRHTCDACGCAHASAGGRLIEEFDI